MVYTIIMEYISRAIISPENEQKLICLLFGACLIFLANCSIILPEKVYESSYSLIPIPHSITFGDGFFNLGPGSTIACSEQSEIIGEYLSTILRMSTGYSFPVNKGMEKEADINLILDPQLLFLGGEGYTLEVNEDNIKIMAFKAAGLFYGCQTLLQLFPPGIYNKQIIKNQKWKIPFITIHDTPRFTWRGAMLDVARHFFDIQDVKHLIDLMAMHKLNRLHLHLSDDQGWRIEIKSWPGLSLHGGSSQVGEGPGGYYTREEYKEIVHYAGDRFITVIPEIDMPGHTNAALSSYPELNKDGKKSELYRGTKVGFSCLDIYNETVYGFINDVVKELAQLTPGAYIHIGGDEVDIAKKEDYIYFINRVQNIVKSHNKQMIGWEEVSQADLEPLSIVQYWKELNHAKKAAANGNKIIVSPAKKIYLDMIYNDSTPIGQNWAGIINVKDAYIWNPAIPGLPEDNILGIEAPLWTETVKTRKDIEYLIFPRLAGYAEMAWSNEVDRDWQDYRARLSGHGKRLDVLGVNYYKSPLIDW